jgi:broad specificity phosphatase PhoE
MIGMLRAVIMAAVAASVFCAVPSVAAESVYVIRHLQKAAGDDPPLTPEGAAGASKLADILADRGIGAVFATPTRRAIQTATPLAVRLGLPVTRYDPADNAALLEATRAIPGNVLIVGHSNTVPDLVAKFGGERPAPMTEQDYGTIYVVHSGTKEVQEIVLPAPGKAN